MTDLPLYVRGDLVRKSKGFRFPGIVAGCVQNQAGEWRVVVEAQHADFRGMLHIYHPDQLELDKERYDACAAERRKLRDATEPCA